MLVSLKRQNGPGVVLSGVGMGVIYRLSVDGFEYTWAVNVLSPYLLLCLLMDKITSRIVNVSSISAAGRIDFDNLQQEKGYE